MTTIKVSCPHCGDITLEESDVQLTIARVAQWATYEFTCYQCQERIQKFAPSDVLHLLEAAGCPATEIPAEAQELHFGAAITHDDILEFAIALDSQDALAALLA